MRIALLALAGAVFAGNAFAASSPINGSFNVNAQVATSCTVTNVTDIDFGTYDPASANFALDRTANGSIDVRCTKGTVIHLELNEGNFAAAAGCAAPARRMSNGGLGRLNYAIYLDGTYTSTWGCGAAEQVRTAGASNVAEVFTTYGVIPQAQDVPAGTYSDVVAYTVTF